MRTAKLVEMIKELARNNLNETHGQRYKRTKNHLSMVGRYGARVKLAQEDSKDSKDEVVLDMATGSKELLNKNPTVNTFN